MTEAVGRASLLGLDGDHTALPMRAIGVRANQAAVPAEALRHTWQGQAEPPYGSSVAMSASIKRRS